jgi:hypothetical protein
MKRRTICVLVMVVALLAAAPGWAAPAAKVSSPVDQALHWLGQIWRAVWAEDGGCVDPYGRPICGPSTNTQGRGWTNPDGVWTK